LIPPPALSPLIVFFPVFLLKKAVRINSCLDGGQYKKKGNFALTPGSRETNAILPDAIDMDSGRQAKKLRFY